jgi:hypothetical protein
MQIALLALQILFRPEMLSGNFPAICTSSHNVLPYTCHAARKRAWLRPFLAN